ncbi:MAG: hypothetical protein CVU30_01815 [Betaproteobacteria bacterium HGW-Betaproteobacteria-3]|nr:MAG: hypothetical protein CVU30_01815 [Betaproteobacteria bacterium HGW-Betaproteobacteria-3]
MAVGQRAVAVDGGQWAVGGQRLGRILTVRAALAACRGVAQALRAAPARGAMAAGVRAVARVSAALQILLFQEQTIAIWRGLNADFA